MNGKATQLPWTFEASDYTIRTRDFEHCTQMGDFKGCIIADLKPAFGGDPSEHGREHTRAETEANGNLIVRAVNCHDELVATLERAQKQIEQMLDDGLGIDPDDSAQEMLEDIRAALAKAKEK